MLSAVEDYVVRNLSKHDAQDFLVHENIAAWLFEMFLEGGAIERRETPFAGDYFKFNQQAFQRVRPEYLQSSPVHKIAGEIGGRYYADAFEAIEQSRLEGRESEDTVLLGDYVDAEIVPASDRIVRLDHNQREEIDRPVDELIKSVEAENSIDGEDGVRELVLGRLKAGRELVRAGIFSVQSLQLTLIVGLQLLVERYKETAIAIAAAKLLDLLLKQYGIG
ncbi:hypothetical protein [Altererythrobacter sp. GH1-8]|uniref:hypothetical protein n=1 Tax=Altererythrobacter sp. GH1-8 TaxID=3349333 RepID=UPI00374D56F4